MSPFLPTSENSEISDLAQLAELFQISEAQLAANRQNAQKSTGPRTEEGKKRCSINALRHGLTGQFHAFSREDRVAFNAHCTSLMADYQPDTYREKLLVMSIAEDTWRLNRARAI